MKPISRQFRCGDKSHVCTTGKILAEVICNQC